MKIGKIIIVILVVLWFGYSVKAGALGQQVFLPVMAGSYQEPKSPESLDIASNGLSGAVPLDNGGVLVLTLSNDNNFVAYVYDQGGAQSVADAWGVFGKPVKYQIVGCVWVVVESDYQYISAHKITLPVNVGCK